MTAPAVPDNPLGGPSDLQRAWQKMAGGAPKVVDVLMQIATTGESEQVRVNAATNLLKLVGFGGSDEVRVRLIPAEFDPAAGVSDGKISQTKAIADRMARLRDATLAAQPDEEGIVDAVLVEQPD